MKFSVDKIENEIVVLENILDGTKKEVPLIELPFDVTEGNILKFENDIYELDENEENLRRQRIMDKFKKLKK